MNNSPILEATGFLVDEKPYCVWEWDLKRRNLDFISALNPAYFRFMAETFVEHLGADKNVKAALSLRTAYSHALDAFIALVGATIQAPDCVPGWLLKYHQDDLENVARKLNNGYGLATKLKLDQVHWTAFSEVITRSVKFDSEEKRHWVIDGFARAWTLFAHDILNEKFYTEYNNIKHGFRVSLGGFVIAVGEEKTYGISPPPGEMRTLGGSKFGTSFLIPEKLGNAKNHFRLRSVSRNWIPEHFLHRLCLIEMSMGNVIAFLKALHGVDPETLKFSWPADADGFDKPWAGSVGVTDCTMDFEIDTAQLKFFTEDEIRALYSANSKQQHSR